MNTQLASFHRGKKLVSISHENTSYRATSLVIDIRAASFPAISSQARGEPSEFLSSLLARGRPCLDTPNYARHPSAPREGGRQSRMCVETARSFAPLLNRPEVKAADGPFPAMIANRFCPGTSAAPNETCAVLSERDPLAARAWATSTAGSSEEGYRSLGFEAPPPFLIHRDFSVPWRIIGPDA
ncbi:hypothetical protein KM043_012779 [Ampulex compressa]|nr:hypothetical protein KM043_012779 [Ampulex compressa]